MANVKNEQFHEPIDQPDREWFNYRWTEEEIERDKAKQAAVFKRMLQRLETDGHCRYVFHRLAFVLFGDDMEPAREGYELPEMP